MDHKVAKADFCRFCGENRRHSMQPSWKLFFSLKDVHQRLESNSNTQATSHGRATFLFCPSLIAMAFSQRRSLSAFSVVAGFFTLGQVSTWYEPQSRGLTGVKLILWFMSTAMSPVCLKVFYRGSPAWFATIKAGMIGSSICASEFSIGLPCFRHISVFVVSRTWCDLDLFGVYACMICFYYTL